jgi:sterol 3beta-glucosyltransferase
LIIENLMAPEIGAKPEALSRAVHGVGYGELLGPACVSMWSVERMKITIIAHGTRGDVQPILALAKALKARGHQVSMVAGTNFKTWIERHGLEAAPSRVDVQAFMKSASGREWAEHGDSQRQIQSMFKLIDQHGMDMIHDSWAACQDAQVIISNPLSDVFVASIVERLQAKHVSTSLQPMWMATRSGAASVGALLPNRTNLLNYLVGKRLFEPFRWRLMGKPNNEFRQEALSLPPQSYRDNWQCLQRMLVVQGFSTQVVTPPGDWPANIHTTGYWYLDEDREWLPPQALLDFLDAGDQPVYVGFGSMTGRDPQALTGIIVKAMEQCGQRAILQSGWAGMGSEHLPSNVFLLDAAPHSWLFPRMSAIAHHGGAGTTSESLRAGVPTIVVPHLADQPFWGSRVAALGVGPRPIPLKKLSADNLASAIRQVISDPGMGERAAELGARIRAENGIAVAVDVIEEYLGREDVYFHH